MLDVSGTQTSILAQIRFHNWNTSISEVWRKIKAIARGKRPQAINQVKTNDGSITNSPHTVIETIADQFDEASDSRNYQSPFRENKVEREVSLDFGRGDELPYSEFEEALSCSQSRSLGSTSLSGVFLYSPKRPC
uniref:Uncharacterized protein n=1 Tax=Photinus pyralis TaxID=7054 RepID=A0A1Y1N007_PHOPY